MNTPLLPRHVVLDLLPLYLADEVSSETRTQIEDYLASDPALAAQVRSAADEPSAKHEHLRDAAELATVARTKRQLALQRWLFALALTLTAIGFSVSVSISADGVRDVHLMLQEHPLFLGTVLVAAAGCWIAYRRKRRI